MFILTNSYFKNRFRYGCQIELGCYALKWVSCKFVKHKDIIQLLGFEIINIRRVIMASRVVKRGVFEEYEDQEENLKLFLRSRGK